MFKLKLFNPNKTTSKQLKNWVFLLISAILIISITLFVYRIKKIDHYTFGIKFYLGKIQSIESLSPDFDNKAERFSVTFTRPWYYYEPEGWGQYRSNSLTIHEFSKQFTSYYDYFKTNYKNHVSTWLTGRGWRDEDWVPVTNHTFKIIDRQFGTSSIIGKMVIFYKADFVKWTKNLDGKGYEGTLMYSKSMIQVFPNIEYLGELK
jgi:hypothetical protein